MALLVIILTFLVLTSGFALYLVRRDQGEREPVGALWLAFGFGILGLVIALFVEGALLPDITHPESLPRDTQFWTAMAIGVIEELSKAGLLAWFIYGRRYFNEHTDGVIYFALAGLGFGLPENIIYTVQFGASTGLKRVIMTPLFHAATTGLIGYALARTKLDKSTKMNYFAMMLVAAIVLHGLYDFGLFSQDGLLTMLSMMITAGLTAGLFVLYLHARSLDQLMGLSVVGNNSFCRTCGTPNPKHKLYCTHCGNRA